MSAPEGIFPSAAAAASAAAAPAFDPDATRIAPVLEPVTAANKSSFPPSDSLPGHPQTTIDTLPGSATTELPARHAGRYQILDRLGRGGMASVFKAHDPSIGRLVAIKFLHASLCEDEQYRSRFLREARAAGSLSHPNIVTVHDVGEIEGRPYMAMELLDGESLAEVLERAQPLPVRDAVAMGVQLARALDYAHQRGIVHRDIKPGNISCLKGSDTIKVTDFGIAHIESSGMEQRTRVGDVLGTPQYMSPEQTRGEKLDGRSDLFSAGIVLYQMLTGQRPFQGDSLVALAVKIATEEPPPIEKLRPQVPAALRRIVERCLVKDRERRFQSGRELADALSRVLAELDEAERKGENKQRIVPLRVKWAVTMGLVVAVVMALTAAVITQRQYAAMVSQVTDYGASLARFVAAQNAVAALAEDWPVVEVAVQEIMKTRDLQGVTVIDRAGIVRASADPALIGQPYKPSAAEALGTRDGGVTITRFMAKGESVLGFEAPITFTGKPVGRVAIGLAELPLVRVARLSLGLMAVLVLVTVLAVAVAMYFVANWFSRPIKVVSEAMEEIAQGRFGHRIAEPRKDEFGQLFAAFDRMAQALQDTRGGLANTTRTPAAPRTVTQTIAGPTQVPAAASQQES